MWSLATIVVATTALTFGSARHLLQVPDPSSNYNVYVRAIPNTSQQNRAVHTPQEYKPPIFAQFSPTQFEPQPQPPQFQIQAPPKASQYQPPLLPLAQSHPQPPSIPQSQNQQVIYVGGQQGGYPPIGAPSPSQQGPSDVASERKSANKPIQQLIQKAPASEIQFDKGSSAKEKDSKPNDDEYVIYYYYYYDNDTNNNNLTLNFDDIPNLESYDKQSPNKTQQLTGRQLLPVTVSSSISTAQSVQVVGQPILAAHEPILNTTSNPKTATAISVSVSVSEGTSLQPVPNVFRYGSDDSPRVPVTPNLVDPLKEPESSPDNANGTITATTPPSTAELQTPLATDVATIPEGKDEPEGNDVEEETETELTTQDITTITETVTTTEPTTTTTKPGRLNGLAQRKRFGGNAIAPSRRISTTTTTQATVSIASGRRGAFRPTPGSRFRRPGGGITRPTPGTPRKLSDNTLSNPTTPSSTPTKNRFGATRSSTTTKQGSTRSGTTKAQSRTTQTRSRPTVKPGSNPLSRSRSRPSFFRSRNKKVEEAETTTSPPETSQTTTSTKSSEETVTAESTKETEEQLETEETEATVAPTTTTTIAPETRFSGLFRSRPRPNLLANRSRPNPLNRPRT